MPTITAKELDARFTRIRLDHELTLYTTATWGLVFLDMVSNKLSGNTTTHSWSIIAPVTITLLIIASLSGYLINSWWRLIIPAIGSALSALIIAKLMNWPADHTSPTVLFLGTAAQRSGAPQELTGDEAIIAAAHAELLVPQAYRRDEEAFINSFGCANDERLAVKRSIDRLVDNGTLMRTENHSGEPTIRLSTQAKTDYESRWSPNPVTSRIN